MFLKKKDVRFNEEFRLISGIEKARKSLYNLQKWHITEVDSLNAQIPILLAELRYRFLLREARKRQAVNRWYLDR